MAIRMMTGIDVSDYEGYLCGAQQIDVTVEENHSRVEVRSFQDSDEFRRYISLLGPNIAVREVSMNREGNRSVVIAFPHGAMPIVMEVSEGPARQTVECEDIHDVYTFCWERFYGIRSIETRLTAIPPEPRLLTPFGPSPEEIEVRTQQVTCLCVVPMSELSPHFRAANYPQRAQFRAIRGHQDIPNQEDLDRYRGNNRQDFMRHLDTLQRRDLEEAEKSRKIMERATTLLSDVLTEREMEEYKAFQTISIMTSTKGLVRIDARIPQRDLPLMISNAPAYNIYTGDGNYCTVLSTGLRTGEFPRLDHIVMQVLMLKADPDRFFRTANRH